LAPSIQRAVSAYAEKVRASFGARVQKIAVFGSHARGEATPDSDVDVVIVVDELTGPEGRALAHLAGDVLTEHDVLISTFTASTARMNQLAARERLIAQEIVRDGILV
jgi:predicted nucleotidyltransferase